MIKGRNRIVNYPCVSGGIESCFVNNNLNPQCVSLGITEILMRPIIKPEDFMLSEILTNKQKSPLNLRLLESFVI